LNASVYYKYLNLDLGAFREHLPSLGNQEAARVAGVLVAAAALSNPTGKQNSFAAHGVPEVIVVELSKVKRPISYANAFLQPVEGGLGRNLMTESARALEGYIAGVASAYAPADLHRVLLALEQSPVQIEGATPVDSLDQLVETVENLVSNNGKKG
jgi:CRISPR system Cascade subunit CasC